MEARKEFPHSDIVTFTSRLGGEKVETGFFITESGLIDFPAPRLLSLTMTTTFQIQTSKFTWQLISKTNVMRTSNQKGYEASFEVGTGGGGLNCDEDVKAARQSGYKRRSAITNQKAPTRVTQTWRGAKVLIPSLRKKESELLVCIESPG